MGTSVLAGLAREPAATRRAPAVPQLWNRRDCSTLILDRSGRIISCSRSAEQVFRSAPIGMVGRPLSDFVDGLFLAGSSPSYGARDLDHLCADGEWREFDAKEANGRTFPVEVSFTRMASSGVQRASFLVDVRTSAGDPRVR